MMFTIRKPKAEKILTESLWPIFCNLFFSHYLRFSFTKLTINCKRLPKAEQFAKLLLLNDKID